MPFRPSKRLIVIAAMVFIALVATGWMLWPFASTVTPAEFHEIIEGPNGRAATLWKGLSYCGTSGEYAIFCNKLAFISSYYKVRRDQTRGFPEFDFTIFQSK
jgi:hypothetical protein